MDVELKVTLAVLGTVSLWYLIVAAFAEDWFWFAPKWVKCVRDCRIKIQENKERDRIVYLFKEHKMLSDIEQRIAKLENHVYGSFFYTDPKYLINRVKALESKKRGRRPSRTSKKEKS